MDALLTYVVIFLGSMDIVGDLFYKCCKPSEDMSTHSNFSNITPRYIDFESIFLVLHCYFSLHFDWLPTCALHIVATTIGDEKTC